MSLVGRTRPVGGGQICRLGEAMIERHGPIWSSRAYRTVSVRN